MTLLLSTKTKLVHQRVAMSDVSSAATSASDDDLKQCTSVASEPLDINDWLVVGWQAQFGT